MKKKKNPILEKNEIDAIDPRNLFIVDKLNLYSKEEIQKHGLNKIIRKINKEWKDKNG